jgi:phage terminase small subunit
LANERLLPACGFCFPQDSPNQINIQTCLTKGNSILKKSSIKAPAWLRPETKKWFLSVLDDYDLEESDIKLLTLASEAFDRATLARETIAEQGFYFTDRWGAPRKHPAVSVLEASTIAFARLVRELSIGDSEPPSESRVPALRSNRGY